MSSMSDAVSMAYMGNYSRKLRASPSMTDGAGLAPNEKFAGRATPLKGKGCPPPDMREAEYKPSRQFVQGSSFRNNGSLISSHPVAEADDHSFKPTKKFLPSASFKANLSGTGAQVAAQVPEYRKSRSFSSAAPDRSLQATSSRVFAREGGEAAEEPRRPSLKTSIPRPASSEDVMQYRYSEGISTRDYKMTGERVPAPTNSRVDMHRSTQSFMAATNDYSMNKYRGQGSAIVFG